MASPEQKTNTPWAQSLQPPRWEVKQNATKQNRNAEATAEYGCHNPRLYSWKFSQSCNSYAEKHSYAGVIQNTAWPFPYLVIFVRTFFPAGVRVRFTASIVPDELPAAIVRT